MKAVNSPINSPSSGGTDDDSHSQDDVDQVSEIRMDRKVSPRIIRERTVSPRIIWDRKVSPRIIRNCKVSPRIIRDRKVSPRIIRDKNMNPRIIDVPKVVTVILLKYRTLTPKRTNPHESTKQTPRIILFRGASQ